MGDSAVDFAKKQQLQQLPNNLKKPKPQTKDIPLGEKTCQFCDLLYHTFCPDKKAVSQKCKKRWHLHDVCQSRQTSGQKGYVNALEVDTPFLGEINHSSAGYRRAKIGVNGHPLMFKIDTDAAVSVISDKSP